MKRVLALIIAGAFSLHAVAEDWTVDGKTYQNVTVTSVDSSRVHIIYDGGVGSIAISDLPPDLQKRFAPDAQQDQATNDAVAAAEKAQAGKILAVTVGGTTLQLSCPPGMSDIPFGDPMLKALADLTPPNFQPLRNCISAPSTGSSPSPDPPDSPIIISVYSLKDATMDIDPNNFLDVVDHIASDASHGVLASQQEIASDEEVQKRLDQFQQDTGIKVNSEGNIYSLGLVSRSVGCVSFMTAQYLNATSQGQSQRLKSVGVQAYVLVKNKVLVVATSLTKPLVTHDDLRLLKQAAEKYQVELQLLNNS